MVEKRRFLSGMSYKTTVKERQYRIVLVLPFCTFYRQNVGDLRDCLIYKIKGVRRGRSNYQIQKFQVKAEQT